ncbi:hypothetical protein OIU85_008610 [Salix viminalis]|uniref:TOG domain-containing protein n=1 Tax=Salix viminalis TaxID=40686 RepID=A0A9Q0NY45_SALVM|nr:hypothetical protein OIU85_008610 [Salix viminalis]
MYAVEELSKYLHPELQNHYHQKVLPALTKAMDDFSDSKIQTSIRGSCNEELNENGLALALCKLQWITYHFVENCTSNMLEPYLDQIISKLLKCLQKGKQLLKQWALSALAAIAKSSQDRFLEYYRTVMPYLKFVMTKAKGESYGLLLSETISCMTAIWTVIGKDKFSDDTQQVVQVLASTPISNLDIHDPMRIQGLKILWADDDTLATKETANRVINLLRDFKSSLPSHIWSSFLSTLEPSRQNVLQLSLSSSLTISGHHGVP